MINSYLTGNAQQDDHSIHLLFSANRWEAIGGILDRIDRGETIVIDRYSFSGAVYSAAKDNDNLSLQWGRFYSTPSVNTLTEHHSLGMRSWSTKARSCIVPRAFIGPGSRTGRLWRGAV